MALTMLTDNRKDRQRLKQLRLRRKEQDRIIRIIKEPSAKICNRQRRKNYWNVYPL